MKPIRMEKYKVIVYEDQHHVFRSEILKLLAIPSQVLLGHTNTGNKSF